MLVSISAFAAAPAVTTEAATTVTATNSILNATVEAGGEQTSAWFRYATTPPGTCDDTFGARVPLGTINAGEGTAPLAIQHVVTGLIPGATYYFCAVAGNASGLAFGAVQTFTTVPVPFATTLAATQVTGTGAQLEGSGNPSGVPAVGWFRYSMGYYSTCNDSFGTRVPASGGIALGDGSSPQPFSASIAGLSPGVTWYVCAIVENAAGKAFGSVKTFFTPAPPQVTTLTPAGTTTLTVTLKASANPKAAQTVGWFRWDTVNPGGCDDFFGTRVPASGGTALGSGTSSVPFEEVIGGLQPSTTYYFCALASSVEGTAIGALGSFTTPGQPQVTTLTPGLNVWGSAFLKGEANLAGGSGKVWFRVSTSSGTCTDGFGTRFPSSGGVSVSPYTNPVPFGWSQSLTPAVTYHYCAIVETATGTAHGNVVTFTTPSMPTAYTKGATHITGGQATLNGQVNPRGLDTNVWFRYGANPGACDDSFGTRVPANGGIFIGSGHGFLDLAQVIHTSATWGLYYYCVIAENPFGVTFASLQSFRSSSPPAVATLAASQQSNGALLNGAANPRNEATTGWFRLGQVHPGSCDDSFGTRVPATGGHAIGSYSFNDVPFSEPLLGLTPGATYHYCALAQNPTGLSWGNVQSFVVPVPPAVTTTVPLSITHATASLRGTASGNYAATTAWFRISTQPGACNEGSGTRVPALGGATVGALAQDAPFNYNASGLAPDTTYFVCAIAENIAGLSFGGERSFTTLGPPSVTTVAANAVTTQAATLGGSAVPSGSASTGWFRYSASAFSTCSESVGTRAPSTGGTSLGNSATVATAYSHPLGGLQPGRTYWFCAVAENAAGKAFGQVLTFTTLPEAPQVTTTGVVFGANGGATLSGSANPGGVLATGFFRVGSTNPGTCSADFGWRIPSTGGATIAAGHLTLPFSLPSQGLNPGGTYYFCALATNSAGTGIGQVLSFTLPNAPTVTSLPANAVSGTSATLNGSANPNGAATSGFFRYSAAPPGAGCHGGWGTRVPLGTGKPLGAGTGAVPYSQTVTGLSPGTTYSACAGAESGLGTVYGAVETFTTLSGPGITSASASAVTSSGAILNAAATTGGADTLGWFRLSPAPVSACTDTFGTRIPQTGGARLGAGEEPASWSFAAEELVQGVTYYYCALAQNAVGKAQSEILTFTAAVDPPVVSTGEPTQVTGRAARLEGHMPPNLNPAGGWFRLDTAQPTACDDTFGKRVPTSGELTPVADVDREVFFTTAFSLRPNTRYYWCAAASNAGGASFGEVEHFTTAREPPSVSTREATSDEAGLPVLHGTVQPNGSSGLAWFQVTQQYVTHCDRATGESLPRGSIVVYGTQEKADLEHRFEGAAPGTWYYCAAAQTPGGEVFGSVRSFTVGGAETALGCGVTGAGAGFGLWLLLGITALRRRRR